MMKLISRAVMILATAGLATACGGGGSTGDACLSTADCGGGFNCRITGGGVGTCRQAAIPFETHDKICVEDQCGEDADCGGTLTCSGGQCACSNDADCQNAGLGQFCSNGGCVNCRDANDCAAGQICNDGACQAKCTDDFSCHFECTDHAAIDVSDSYGVQQPTPLGRNTSIVDDIDAAVYIAA